MYNYSKGPGSTTPRTREYAYKISPKPSENKFVKLLAKLWNWC